MTGQDYGQQLRLATPPEAPGPWAYGVPLRRRDGTIRAWATVDVADWRLVAPYRWSLAARGYVARYPGPGVTVYLHRHLVGLEPGTDPRAAQVDHVNRDKLDNRRLNLRVVSARENCANRGGYFDRKAA